MEIKDIVPPKSRRDGRNSNWRHYITKIFFRCLINGNIHGMPLGIRLHCVPLAMIDPDFAKDQLMILTKEWYMHPNGQIPAYEWRLGMLTLLYMLGQHWKYRNRNIWLSWCRFLKDFPKVKYVCGGLIRLNREECFRRWVLRLDNIGVFDRSNKLPGGGVLGQADGTADGYVFIKYDEDGH